MLNLQKQKGAVAIILSILILSALLTISLALSGLVVQQIRLSNQIGESTGAYSAADSGVEFALYNINRQDASTTAAFLSVVDGLDSSDNYCSGGSIYWFPVSADTSFCLDLIEQGGDIIGIKTIGRYKGARRAIELNIYTPPEYIYKVLAPVLVQMLPRCNRADGVSEDCDKDPNKYECPSPSFPAGLTEPSECYDWDDGATAIKYEKQIKP